MTITADARSSASTAAGRPTSSRPSDDAPRTDVVSPYGMAPSAPGDPHGGAQTADSHGSEPDAARAGAHTPSAVHRRLPPAPVRARVVAGVIDLVIGSLLVGGLTTVIWQVGGRPALTSGLIAFGLVVGARWLAIAATGWSLGGRLLRIRMLGARNQTPSPLGSFLHADLILAVSITTLGLGTIALMRTAAADPEGRGWHDKLSGMALLSARRTKRPARPVSSATEPQGRPATEPDSSSPRADAGAEAPEASSAQDIGEAWDAARRASLSSSESSSGGQSTTSQEPAAAPSSPATEAPDESAPRTRPSERAVRKTEKKAGKTARGKKPRKRGPRPDSTRARAGQETAQETQQAATAGAQSATEAGITGSSGRNAHPTTSDPVSSSIRRPRPARPARHAGRALKAGSSDGYAPAVSGGSAAGQAASTDAATIAAAPQVTVKATKAATVSSSASAKSAAEAGPAIVDTDAEAVAVASATPMDPQASAAMAAARADSRPAVAEASKPSTGPADEDTVATAPEAAEDAAPPAHQDTEPAPLAPAEATEPEADDAAPAASSQPAVPEPTEETAEETAEEAEEAVDEHVEEPVDEPAADVEEPSGEPSEADAEEPPAAASSDSDDAPTQQPSQTDSETATLDVVEDAPSQSTDAADGQGDEAEKPSSHAPPSPQHPADQQQSEATTPSAESSKTAADSEATESSTSHDATSTPQVPRSKATKPVTSQTMEPRHAHAQRWRIQPGHTGKKTSGSSAAPAEDQRESVSQPGVPRRESLFASDRQRFAAGAGPVPEVAHTFDTSSILPSGDRNTQALIDSVPWSSVPTSVDAATVDSLPEGAIVSDDGLPQQPKTVSAPAQHASPMDLTNPATVPGGVPASSEGNAHPTVRSHRSHARTSAGSAASTAAAEGSSARRSHASHRFSGPGIPSPADERAVPGESRSDAPAAEAGAARHERSASVQASAQPQSGVSRHGAGSMPEAAASASAPAAGVSLPPRTPVPATSAQTATPSLPSASSAAPALSVRLVPLLGGNPIVIHEPTVVGRDPDNISAYPGAERVALDDPTRSVSKTHAAIFPLLDGVWVTDLHSTNGTRVEYRDGRTVEAVPDKALSALEGSTIFFGRIAFKVEVV